jgi:hypothetical protein
VIFTAANLAVSRMQRTFEPLSEYYQKYQNEKTRSNKARIFPWQIPLENYYVALAMNFAAFLLPPLYTLLAKMWLVDIDWTRVVVK